MKPLLDAYEAGGGPIESRLVELSPLTACILWKMDDRFSRLDSFFLAVFIVKGERSTLLLVGGLLLSLFVGGGTNTFLGSPL